jgi:hypothetical protein
MAPGGILLLSYPLRGPSERPVQRIRELKLDMHRHTHSEIRQAASEVGFGASPPVEADGWRMDPEQSEAAPSRIVPYGFVELTRA